MAAYKASKIKPRKLGIAPTLVVMVLVFGLAVLIGVILLMMYVRTGIEHSPEQSRIMVPANTTSSLHHTGVLQLRSKHREE